jgi:hypothetical protein
LSFRLCDSEGLTILGIYARAGNDKVTVQVGVR